MWFMKIEECDDNPDSHGFHENFCNGKSWVDKGTKYICCGSRSCYYCGTPMHGCTENVWESNEKQYHLHCKK
jgi:hypothetical protein